MTAPSDLAERLAALHAEAFAAGWSAAALAELLAMPGAETAVEDDGFILWRLAADEAEIVTLAVRPDARRLGLGGRLLDRALAGAVAKGAGRMLLEVAADNAAALALYRSRGFQQAGLRPRYYDRGAAARADALIMALNLA